MYYNLTHEVHYKKAAKSRQIKWVSRSVGQSCLCSRGRGRALGSDVALGKRNQSRRAGNGKTNLGKGPEVLGAVLVFSSLCRSGSLASPGAKFLWEYFISPVRFGDGLNWDRLGRETFTETLWLMKLFFFTSWLRT